MSITESPIALSDLEAVLAWVDTFKLSRPTKKINRDFSDAVLLAEILGVHYPKLVEMHNYPPRNSHSLKLNNWMTLNRKVLKKLRLNLCCNTMEQLANCAPGVIERVLIMVRDKIRRDEELNRSMNQEQNLSSGGSYYETCGDEANVLVVPVKSRINGILETVQRKVVCYDSYMSLKEEMKDAKESIEVLKQKVEHLDNLLKLKDERIDELQKQLERKQFRRKEVEALQNSLVIPFELGPPSPKVSDVVVPNKPLVLKISDSNSKIPKLEDLSRPKSEEKIPKEDIKIYKVEESRIPMPEKRTRIELAKSFSKPSITEVTPDDFVEKSKDVDKIRSEVFFEGIEIIDQRTFDNYLDNEEFKDTESDLPNSIQKDISDITQINFIPDAFVN
ncbi:unnamed protein product [Pieris macdunnoughi]|uniref:Calponin-homology (CH) domain-containing protein n=1 Tax=Pieris macdunnoughi TaxID=345717 RepID=A0A821R793_9NEOP|nr:unnamed protein product [Pieris macdunnoughi]